MAQKIKPRLYVVTQTFAGVPHGRGVTFDKFADANRFAMAETGRTAEVIRIYSPDNEEIVAYVRGLSGRASIFAVAGDPPIKSYRADYEATEVAMREHAGERG